MDAIPIELKVDIAEYLPLKDRGALGQTNKEWRKAVTDDQLWRGLASDLGIQGSPGKHELYSKLGKELSKAVLLMRSDAQEWQSGRNVTRSWKVVSRGGIACFYVIESGLNSVVKQEQLISRIKCFLHADRRLFSTKYALFSLEEGIGGMRHGLVFDEAFKNESNLFPLLQKLEQWGEVEYINQLFQGRTTASLDFDAKRRYCEFFPQTVIQPFLEQTNQLVTLGPSAAGTQAATDSYGGVKRKRETFS